MAAMMAQPRTYHRWIDSGDLHSFQVTLKETELYIRAETNLRRRALRLATKYRTILEKYVERQPVFLTALTPQDVPADAPMIVKHMAEAARMAGVGPMAAVAGAIAGAVGQELLPFSRELLVENGGDIFLSSRRERIVGIYAGSSPLSGRIGLMFRGHDDPLGICTSSGTVGHSLSYGRADAVIIVAGSTSLADAAATAVGNLIYEPGDIPTGIERARNIEGLIGAVIIQGEEMGIWGDLEICETDTAAALP
jgi:ApbE superfamily uncharacterized protein (UPF0280 family)